MEDRYEMIGKLKQDLLIWQGFKPPSGQEHAMGLGAIEEAFPNGVFPTGRVHEFLSSSWEDAAASRGFMGTLLASLMQREGICLWIATAKTVFMPGMCSYGVEPNRIVFVQMNTEKDVRWAMEEALQCGGLAAVVAELSQLTFVQSRRLQLLVEKSGVTGFVLCHQRRAPGQTACVARWQISPLTSLSMDGVPGVGFPTWEVRLLKVRNGHPGNWKISWYEGQYENAVRDRQREPWTDGDRKVG